MTISITDLLAIVGLAAAVVAVPSLVAGAFLGARLARSRTREREVDHAGTLAEFLHFLREALVVVHEWRSNPARGHKAVQPAPKKKTRRP